MRYITVKNLSVGMTLGRDLLDEKGNILLRAGNCITKVVFDRIILLGIQGLYIEDEISKDIVVEDLIDSTLRYNAMKALMNNNIPLAIVYAKKIVNELKKKDSLQVNLIDIKNNENYTYKHCVSTCVYSVIVGLSLGMNEDQLSHLAVAAMLHDIGKFKLPISLLHKEGPFTPKEYNEIKNHAKFSYDESQKYNEISSISRNAILYHHENVNGTGYFSLPADKQTVYVKILHLVDVYDAMNSKRKYRESHTPQESIEFIMGNSDILFDKEIVNIFTQKFPIYPIGLTVSLSNGEKAVIVTNEHNSLRPIIRLLNKKKNYPLIDLSDNKDYFNVTITGIV